MLGLENINSASFPIRRVFHSVFLRKRKPLEKNSFADSYPSEMEMKWNKRK